MPHRQGDFVRRDFHANRWPLTVVCAAGTAALATVVLLTQSGVAAAPTTLRDGITLTVRGHQPHLTDYSITTSRPYWSAVIVTPQPASGGQGHDFAVNLY